MINNLNFDPERLLEACKMAISNMTGGSLHYKHFEWDKDTLLEHLKSVVEDAES